MKNPSIHTLTRKTSVALVIILATTAIACAPIIHYSVWSIDEQNIVRFALGFLDLDLNPHFFIYHTLPMYVLSLFYWGIFIVFWALGIVASKQEFASLLFSNDAVLYLTARIVFATVYVSGCYVLAYMLYKKHASILFASLFFASALLVPDALRATTMVRVDTFVFFFLVLLVWCACFARKRFSSFLFSTVFCAAAIASKITAIVLVPVLLLVLCFDVYKRHYPLYYLLLTPALLLLFVFLFMPYAFLSFEDYRPVLTNLLDRASGSFIHVGKVHQTEFLDKLLAPWQKLIAQIGWVSLILSGLLWIWSMFRNRALSLYFFFPLTYLLAFSTSATMDSYWLRPVYPFVLFFAFLSLSTLGEHLQQRISGNDGERGAAEKKRFVLRVVMVSTAVAFTFSLFVHNQGPYLYWRGLTDTRIDTRIPAAEWIARNMPDDALIVLEGWIPHYYPNVLSTSRNTSLRIFGYHIPWKNELIMSGFDIYYKDKISKERAHNVLILNGLSKGYRAAAMRVPRGSYVVLTSRHYDRFFRSHTKKVARELSNRAEDFYRWIKGQTLVTSFEGKGGNIEIYRIERCEQEANFCGSDEPIPKSATEYINLSLQYYRDGEWEKCIESSIGALNINPSSAVAYNNICAAYVQLKDFDRAILACNKALALRPDFSHARGNLNAAIKQKGK